MSDSFKPNDPTYIANVRDKLWERIANEAALVSREYIPHSLHVKRVDTLCRLHESACRQLESAHMPPTISIREDVLIELKSDLQAMIDDGSLDDGDNLTIGAAWVDRLQHILDTKGGKK